MATSMARWAPLDEMISLREAMDQMFNDAFIGSQSRTGTQDRQSGWALPLDVMENDDNFVVRTSLPGVNPQDVDITVRDNVVTIQGETRQEPEAENQRYLMREHRYGRFYRSITLPVTVDGDKVQAEFRDGILTLTLPKAEQAKPKRISIRSDGQRQTVEGQATMPSGQPAHS